MNWFRPSPRGGRTALLVSLVASITANAGIVFKESRILLKPTPDQEEVNAVFTFRNTGDTPARVITAVSGCQCLAAHATSGEIAPGAEGSVTGTMKVGATAGVTEKNLQVRVEEGGKQRTVSLTVAMELPELIRIAPRTLSWSIGVEATEQTITLTMSGDQPIHLLKAETSRPGFSLRTETVREGAEYRVHVKPIDASRPILGVINFTTDCPYPRFAKPIAFANIRRQ